MKLDEAGSGGVFFPPRSREAASYDVLGTGNHEGDGEGQTPVT